MNSSNNDQETPEEWREQRKRAKHSWIRFLGFVPKFLARMLRPYKNRDSSPEITKAVHGRERTR
jgi:hypothetical protein